MPAKSETKAEAAAEAAGPETERADHEAAEREQPEPEVRPDEFAAGIDAPVGVSLFPSEVVEELRKPLDPNRVRSRQGRGNTKLEYLAGHDVKRRASEIFGFGRWGHRVVEIVELGAVAVTNKDGKDGWHVAFRCTVEVWVGSPGQSDVFVTQGVGYGDGVEYTPAARVTACELAAKESETDALKRAFTDLGDQFGLILYAKGDEKARISRDRDAADTDRAVVRQEQAGRVETPRDWPQMFERFKQVLGGTEAAGADAGWWLNEAITSKFGARLKDLPQGQQREAWALVGAVVLTDLEEAHGDLSLTTGVRAIVRAAFAARNGGVQLEGPPWRLGPDEPDRPTRDEWESARAASAEADAEAQAGQDASDAEADLARATAEQQDGAADEDIPFGEKS